MKIVNVSIQTSPFHKSQKTIATSEEVACFCVDQLVKMDNQSDEGSSTYGKLTYSSFLHKTMSLQRLGVNIDTKA